MEAVLNEKKEVVGLVHSTIAFVLAVQIRPPWPSNNADDDLPASAFSEQKSRVFRITEGREAREWCSIRSFSICDELEKMCICIGKPSMPAVQHTCPVHPER